MRCFLLSWFNILVSISLLSRLVHGLQITIEEGDGGITINNPTTIRWNQEPTDPPDFDFRFVVGQFNDVGLAAANIKVDQPVGDTGVVQVIFPRPGRFVIKAVSGSPQFSVIGTSNEVEVRRPAPSSSAAPTASEYVSPFTRSSFTERIRRSTEGKDNGTSTPTTTPSTRSGVIAGIVIGTLALILIIGLFLFFWLRHRTRLAQKAQEERRVSFHPEQMVQTSRRERFLSIGRFTFRTTTTASSHVDAEQGMGGTITPFPPPVPSPPSLPPSLPPPASASRIAFVNPFLAPGESSTRALPTPPPASALIRPLPSLPPPHPVSSSPSLVHHLDNVAGHQRALPARPRTERQQQLASRLTQVKEQIRVLKRNSGGLDMVMEDLSKQVKWLEEHSESEWALGLTDVPPTGFARYMTP
ncbi:hypothetical protein BKA70DRAFT_347693 [Coprinopsis sp. MPI-PUGE-AT-0042]|nr:hypothetical protein BKA70DRAFT_347693 [Coprinopsis sp. MPI-PUGE-AT-0042]